VTLKKRFAALLVVPALTLGAGLFAAGTAAASTASPASGCRNPPVYADGLTVSTCITQTGPSSAYGNVRTSGSNNTLINLCVELVDGNQNLVPNSRDCQTQPGSDGSVLTPTMYNLAPGTYYAVSYFTSPTYWYGGESPGISAS
jgi:hypothetical protein